jgi:NAD+ synthase (glutamine-hydrolysing)
MNWLVAEIPRRGGTSFQSEFWRNRPPPAELRPVQKDTDSLPPYEVLDPILHAYVEESCSVTDIVRHGFDEDTVRRVIRMVDRNKYKRRQSQSGLKITPWALGNDWRLPITNKYQGGSSYYADHDCAANG